MQRVEAPVVEQSYKGQAGDTQLQRRPNRNNNAVVTEEAKMADNNRDPSETETIMMALDQISQTIEVMTSVVGRLRTYVQERDATAEQQGGDTNSDAALEIQSDRILH